MSLFNLNMHQLMEILGQRLAYVTKGRVICSYDCNPIGHVSLDIWHQCTHNHGDGPKSDGRVPLENVSCDAATITRTGELTTYDKLSA